MGFSDFEPTSKSLQFERKKGVSMPGRKSAPMFQSEYSQWNSISCRSDNLYLFVSIFYAATLESTSTHISCVLCWFALSAYWDSSKMIPKKSLGAAVVAKSALLGDFLENWLSFLPQNLYCHNDRFRTEIWNSLDIVVRNWEDHAAWRLKLYKLIWNQPMGAEHVYAIKASILVSFGAVLVDCDWPRCFCSEGIFLLRCLDLSVW